MHLFAKKELNLQRILYIRNDRNLIGMKKFIFFAIAFCTLLACSSELDDVKKEIEDLERQALELQRQKDSIENAIKNQQGENDSTQDKIDQTEYNLHPAFLKYMEFLSSDNPVQMVEDAKCEIIGDSVVECWITNIMDNKKLIPRFVYEGTEMTIDGKEVVSGETIIDFRKPISLVVKSKMQTKSYTVYVHSYTGIPMLWLETDKRENIALTTKYYQANLKLVEDVKTRAAGDVIEARVRVRGVGDISWYQSKVHPSLQIGKNSYAILFSEVVSLFDEPKNNDWELMPNADDNTMLRTQTMFYMGHLSNLPFTPRYHFVDLMLNGRYYGTYMLGDRMENASARVDVGFNGYILKIDAATTGVNFTTSEIEQPLSILTPSVLVGDNNYRFIASYLESAEEALFGDNFKNESEGWQKYLDMDSFVDWYLINEIAKNEDAFQAECYMNMKKSGKLRMGPLWKAEKSFGFEKSSYSGFVVKNTKWYNRLFQDPAFVAKVKERFAYFYKHKNTIIKEISANAEYLKRSAQENSNKWDVFDKSAGDTKVQYLKTVSSMKDWLEKRMDWMNTEFGNM